MHLFTGDRDQLEGYDSEKEIKLSSSVSVCVSAGGGRGERLVVLRYVLQKHLFISLKKSQGRIKLSKKSAFVMVVSGKLAIIKITVCWIKYYIYQTCV